MKSSHPLFGGSRSLASTVNGPCTEVVEQLILAPPALKRKHSDAILAFQSKNNLWNKILSAKDFEHFDEALYFRTLEIYSNEHNLTLLSPVTTEEKMALIEVIQNRYAYFIGVPALQEELATLNAKQLHKISKLMKKFEPSSQVTREGLQSFTSELFIILKGPPVTLLDYFTENKTELMNKRLYRIVQEELLLKGLKNVINQFPEKTRYSHLENAKLHINRIVRSKIWRFAALPLDLPFIDQVKLSDELLEKILLDGVDAHSDELISIFRQQNMIDHYERFRKAYRTIAFATAFYYFYQEDQDRKMALQKEREKQEEEKKQEFLNQFKALSTTITNIGPVKEMTDKELKDEQFKRTLQKFREKYNEDPSPEEYQEIKQKIYDI